MQSIALTAIYLFFFVAGFSGVFVIALGYVWVDLFSPQQLSYSIINDMPISMIIGVMAVGGYFLFDRREPPKFVLGLKLIALWALWITLTSCWAEVPVAAWEKWDWAIKTVLFSAFLPFVIRSRIQIEALILTIVFSVSGTIIAGGIRTLITGGGYQVKLGLLTGNSGLAEGSTLSTTSIALIPLILYSRKHTRIIPSGPLYDCFCFGLIGAAALTALGSFERTGIVALATLGLCLWTQSRHKILYGCFAFALALIGLAMMSGAWHDRMATMSNFRAEDSALVRIAVWLWTLQYVGDHPFGGGFGVYLIDKFTVPIAGTDGFLSISARAFHSIYFEVLGEQGIVGFGIFASMIGCMFTYLRQVKRAGRLSPDDGWLFELANALTFSALVYLSGGTFVGIAFQPMLYYWIACSISLHQYVARAQGQRVAPSGRHFARTAPSELR